MQLSPWPPCIVDITRPLASVTTCREAASTGVAKVAAVSKTADRSFTLRIGVLHWSGKPGWLLPVTCGRTAIVQRAYRFTRFQLGVKSTRVPICCLSRAALPCSHHRGGRIAAGRMAHAGSGRVAAPSGSLEL